MSDVNLGRARGLNSIADPSEFKGSRGRSGRRQAAAEVPATSTPPPPVAPTADHPSDHPAGRPADTVPAEVAEVAATAPHRAVVPGLQRKRRELSVPIPVAEAVADTGINPADLVMAAYRRHSDAIYAGAGGRMVSRGRQRLRVSISDAEFDKLTRLGESRGWNRSETVAVLLTLELLDEAEQAS